MILQEKDEEVWKSVGNYLILRQFRRPLLWVISSDTIDIRSKLGPHASFIERT
jgi:hypothetical protein